MRSILFFYGNKTDYKFVIYCKIRTFSFYLFLLFVFRLTALGQIAKLGEKKAQEALHNALVYRRE
ncbi:hypothetical protein J22TS3_32750 [Paenibacillus sp. J22TS3]|nr:hypothetical protein J22TS3_32750 [Paenibacillus sp. J22TS3]